ncbi:MAG TPA: hypothetical protein VK168_07535, partial [Saprospiraceae bacterium]|nr:hypothetical protein [Saprospiraceae bacterium]
MTQLYTCFRWILPVFLTFFTFSVKANGDPTNGNPTNGTAYMISPDGAPLRLTPNTLDSLSMIWGHCNPITVATPNCATQTIELAAFVQFLFSGQNLPIVVLWNTGEFAHKITVTPPGSWEYDPLSDPNSAGCEQVHWDNTYTAQGVFFDGPMEIIGPLGICPETEYELTVNGLDSVILTEIEWMPGGSSNIPLTIDGPGTYTLTIEDEFGCPFTDNITIPLSPPVQPVLSGPLGMCTEADTGFIQIFPNFSAYLWDNGQTTNPLTVYEPGTYTVTVTNNLGCTGTKEFWVPATDVPEIGINMSVPAICPGQNSILSAPFGYTTYQWSNNINGAVFVTSQSGTYTVTVTNAYGCSNTGSVTLDSLPTPTINIATTPFCPGGSSTLTA